MKDKKLVILINQEGQINAETFGYQGPHCVDEIHRLMKDIADLKNEIKKPEYDRGEIIRDNTVVTNRD
jgi:hypothetical protein